MGKLDMTTDLSKARLREILADSTRANNSGIRHLPPDEAMDVLTSTLLDFRAYCKDHRLKLLNYLLEMGILEAIEVQMSLSQGVRADACGGAPCRLSNQRETQDELRNDNNV